MNNPCPICGKERGYVVGDYPPSYFCEGHKNNEQQQPTHFYYDNNKRIVELLEKIIEILGRGKE